MTDDLTSAPQPTPVVLTAEEIFLYIHGSLSNALTQEQRAAMTDQEYIDYHVDNAQRRKINHLTADKLPVLEAQLADPDSWVNRAKQMKREEIKFAGTADWFQILSNRHRARHGQPLYQDKNQPRRGDPQVAVVRDAIVQFVRNASEKERLTAETAERVLAEAGESLSWIDSVPDRLIMSEAIVPPVRGGPVERRKLLATFNYALSDLMAEQNGNMRQRLTELAPEISRELDERLARLERGPELGRGG